MHQTTQHLLDELRERLQSVQQQLLRRNLLVGLIWTVAIAATAFLVAAFAESILWLETELRSGLLGGLVAFVVLIGGYCVGRPLLQAVGLYRPIELDDVARAIGDHYPDVGDRLINLLQLARGQGSIANPDLQEAAVKSLLDPVRQTRFEQLVDWHKVIRESRWLLLPLILGTALAFTGPERLLNGGSRILSPGTTFERPAPFSWRVSPADTSIVRGENVVIQAYPSLRTTVEDVRLELQRNGESSIETVAATPGRSGEMTHRMRNVRRSFRYRVRSPQVDSDWHHVRVLNRPLLRSFQVALDPPAYTNSAPRELPPNVGDINALPGTRAHITVETDCTSIASAKLAFNRTAPVPLSLDSSTARGVFQIDTADSYQIRLKSSTGITNAKPVTYHIEPLTDAAPTINLERPDRVAELGKSGPPAIVAQIADDYGFSRLELHYRLSESQYGSAMDEYRTIELPLESPNTLDQEIQVQWDIAATTDLNPVPGDAIEYYLQVWDNNTVTGPQSARTTTHTFQFPSIAEQYQAVDQQQSSIASELEAVREEARSIQKTFESIQQQLRQSQQGSWSEEHEVKQLRKRQAALEKRTQQLGEEVQSLTNRMEQQDLVEPRTLRMYEELQKVVESIDSADLQKALSDLQKAMSEMNFEQMQQAMETFEFNEEQYQKRLQRTLDLFRNLRTQQQLDEVSRRLGELADLQEQLADETENLEQEGPNEKTTEPSTAINDRPRSNPSEQTSDSDHRADQFRRDSLTAADRRGAPRDSLGGPAESRSRVEQPEQPSEATSSPPRSAVKPNKHGQSTPRHRRADSLANQQQQASQRMSQLEKRLEEIRRQAQSNRDNSSQQLEQLQKKLNQQTLAEQMKNNSHRLRQQQYARAQQQQRALQQTLSELSDQVQQMKQRMRGQQLSLNISALRRILHNVLTLSSSQEDLRSQVSPRSSNNTQLRELATEQQTYAELVRGVADSLYEVAREVPRLSNQTQMQTGDILRAMERAVQALTQHNAEQASSYQKQAMASLNHLALSLSQLLEQLKNMQQAGAGMSMQQMTRQLQQMAGQQQKLNQQLQQLLNDIQGNRLTQQQQQRLGQMARRQAQIRRQLEQLSKNENAQNQLLGDLEKIAEDMEDSIRELRDRRMDQETVKRQQQILSRMLQAQQSLYTRGKQKQRKASPGNQVSRDSPPEIQEQEEEIRTLRQDLIHALEQGYTPDYEELIRRYFEVLRERTTKNQN